MVRGISTLLAVLFVGTTAGQLFANTGATLSGEWSCRLDPQGIGEGEKWFEHAGGERVHLPGSTDENRLGELNEESDRYNHLSRLRKYVGPAWYQREIEIPPSWQDKHIVLFLERCHWQTKVWVDGDYAGTQDSLCTPHQYDLSRLLTPGTHRLTLCVDNTPKHFLGPFASSISEETQTNWNGIVGRIELRVRDRVWIEDAHVYPDIARKEAEVRLKIRNQTGGPVRGELTLRASSEGLVDVPPRTFTYEVSGEEATLTVRLPLGEDAALWSEFSPALYRLSITLKGKGADGSYTDQLATVFGMREFAVKDKRFVLNGDAIFLRGTLECCIFPLTGYPPTDVAAWDRIFGICESYGLNHMRFHSWCPPEAAFHAADKAGFFIQAEAPRANVGTDDPLDKFIQEESLRILDTYGNHPSFVLMSMGNELSVSDDVLTSLLETLQAHDCRHLYTASTGMGPQTSKDEFRVRHEGRGIGGTATSRDLSVQVEAVPVPLISHEIGQWAVYPALDEIEKYTGWLKPRNFELVRDDLESKGMLDQAAAFTRVTGKHSALLYKEEIEVLLRTPGLAGFQLLDLHDYPGTGMALVGLLDAFWDPKGVISPSDFRQFCGETVPLLRMARREYLSSERFAATAEIVHYGRNAIDNAAPLWTLEDETGHVVASGEFPTVSIPRATRIDLGKIDVDLSGIVRAAKAKVTVALKGTEIANHWDIWVYSAEVDAGVAAEILVSKTLDDKAIAALEQGERVLLMAARPHLRKTLPGRFVPVFWSPIWFPSANVPMSILCDPKHPALAHFPTESYSNWQWWDLLQNSSSIILDDLPADFRPIVQVVDNFSRNHRLGNLLEAKVGAGKLLLCSIDIDSNLDKRPAARQMRYSLLEYMRSPSFDPGHAIDFETLRGMFKSPPVLVSLGAKVIKVDSEDTASGNVAANAIDGDPNSYWCTQWVGQEPPFPHEIVIDMGREIELTGFRLLPRQDGNSNGWFARSEFYVGNDPSKWGEPVARTQFAVTADEKTVIFDRPGAGRYIRLVAADGIAGNPWAAIAELDVIRSEER